MSRQVHVHIGRLVLRGVGADQRDAVAAGLRAELERQLARSADGLERRAVPSLRLKPFSLPTGGSPEQCGRLAGRAVGRGLLR